MRHFIRVFCFPKYLFEGIQNEKGKLVIYVCSLAILLSKKLFYFLKIKLQTPIRLLFLLTCKSFSRVEGQLNYKNKKNCAIVHHICFLVFCYSFCCFCCPSREGYESLITIRVDQLSHICQSRGREFA